VALNGSFDRIEGPRDGSAGCLVYLAGQVHGDEVNTDQARLTEVDIEKRR
jgi:hypothetical protein